MNKKGGAWGSLLCSLLIPAGVFSQDVGANLDLMHRFTITINAKADKVWPYLFHGDQWGWFGKVANVKLTGEQEGGVVALYVDAKADTPTCLIKTVRIQANKWYGFSIYCYGYRFNGFGSFNLDEKNGATQLTYDLFLHNLPTPAPSVTDDQIRKMTADEMRTELADKTLKLGKLKSVVEKAGGR